MTDFAKKDEKKKLSSLKIIKLKMNEYLHYLII